MSLVVSDKKQYFINKLPNDVLTFILSKLQVDEDVRCNILSKRWVGLWKQARHIEFNSKHVIKPLNSMWWACFQRSTHLFERMLYLT